MEDALGFVGEDLALRIRTLRLPRQKASS
jgi:hypothetical protein